MGTGFRVALAASIILCTGAAPAGAFETGGTRWPGKPTARIAYYNAAPQWRAAVTSATRAWNAGGARVKFVATTKRRANLEIRYMSGGEQRLAHGRATLGYNKPSKQNRYGKPYNFVWLPRLSAGQAALQARGMEIVAAHELGHVLGLHHENRRCSLMSATGRYPRCPSPPDDRYERCDLLTQDDVTGAIRRYGGRSRLSGPEFCLIPMESPSVLGTSFDSSRHVVRLRLRNPYSSRFAGLAHARSAAGGPCPAAPDSGSGDDEAAPGAESEIGFGGLSRGRYCVSIWSRDSRGGLSSAPTTAYVDVPSDPPAEPAEAP